jgi:quercetin dioxygenase-like cupin family protein
LRKSWKKICERNVEISSTTALKTATLRVVLMALKAGGRLAEHHPGGRLLLQVMEGEIEFDAESAKLRMSAGMLASVEARVQHAVTALSDAVLLLTIAWPAPQAKVDSHRTVGYEK